MTLEAHFINDLGMDSLDAVEVVMAFEDEFGKSWYTVPVVLYMVHIQVKCPHAMHRVYCVLCLLWVAMCTLCLSRRV